MGGVRKGRLFTHDTPPPPSTHTPHLKNRPGSWGGALSSTFLRNWPYFMGHTAQGVCGGGTSRKKTMRASLCAHTNVVHVFEKLAVLHGSHGTGGVWWGDQPKKNDAGLLVCAHKRTQPRTLRGVYVG